MRMKKKTRGRNIALALFFTLVFVPFTVQFSNSFYENLGEIWDLRKTLINEGIMDKNGIILPKTRLNSNSNIPYRN